MTAQAIVCSMFRFSTGVGVLLLGFGFAVLEASAEVTMEWVTVGDPGNEPDTEAMECCDEAEGTSGFGSVSHPYRIAKYEVTNGQYVEFLNVVDPTGENILFFYNPEMTFQAICGIDIDLEASLGSRYEVKSGFENKPVSFVNFIDAMRFTNRLHNGQGSGDTEAGAYTLIGGAPSYPQNTNSVTRNPGVRSEGEGRSRILVSSNRPSAQAAHASRPPRWMTTAAPTSTSPVATAAANFVRRDASTGNDASNRDQRLSRKPGRDPRATRRLWTVLGHYRFFVGRDQSQSSVRNSLTG